MRSLPSAVRLLPHNEFPFEPCPLALLGPGDRIGQGVSKKLEARRTRLANASNDAVTD